MDWLRDLTQSRKAKEKEREREGTEYRKKRERAFASVDKMVTACLHDLGRAYWSLSFWSSARVRGDGWSWILDENSSSHCEFKVSLRQHQKGSDQWHFEIETEKGVTETADLSESELKQALRRAFEEGPYSHSS